MPPPPGVRQAGQPLVDGWIDWGTTLPRPCPIARVRHHGEQRDGWVDGPAWDDFAMLYYTSSAELQQYMDNNDITPRPGETHFDRVRRILGWEMTLASTPTNRQLAFVMDLCRELRIFPSQEAYQNVDVCRRLILYLTDRADWDAVYPSWQERFIFNSDQQTVD